MTFGRLLFLALLGVAISGCMRAGLTAINLPASFGHASIYDDISYGSNPWEKMDIYVPAGTKSKKRDVLVFYYGGRWESGQKEDYKFIASTFVHQGFVVVIPDYRKYPDVRFPQFVQDGAKALAWTYDHIEKYGGAKNHIHVAGHSAGAHIGALLTADESYLKALGKNRKDVIQDFAGLAGPYAFTPDEKDLQYMFGPPENYPRMQVTSFIDGSEPPMLLLYGDADNSVGRFNLDRLQNTIRQKHGCVKSIIYPGISHVGLVTTLSWVNKNKAPVRYNMADFFLKPKSCP